jgi:hypothetical protein
LTCSSKTANHGYGAEEHNANSATVEELVAVANGRDTLVEDERFVDAHTLGESLTIVGPTGSSQPERRRSRRRPTGLKGHDRIIVLTNLPDVLAFIGRRGLLCGRALRATEGIRGNSRA